MIIQEKNRHSEPSPFITLSRKAFAFWFCFVTALFAAFFFAGTLVGRGQIKIDLGQHALFQEINGLSQSVEEPAQTVQTPETSPDESTDFGFYDGLASKEPSKELAATPVPSTRKKTKQVVKKNLKTIKPEDVDKPEAATAALLDDPPKPSTKDKPKQEAAPAAPAEKPVAEKAKKPRADSVEKARTEAEEKPKKEMAVKDKAAAVEKKSAEPKAKEAVKTDESPKKFSLQVAALRNAADAETMVKKLNSLGFSAHTVKSNDSAPWYKVRVGSYKDRADAENTRAKLKNKNFDSFVIAQ